VGWWTPSTWPELGIEPHASAWALQRMLLLDVHRRWVASSWTRRSQ
jgi:hypothetical protein